MTLISIAAANFICRALAVALACWLSFRLFARFSNVISSLAAGLMLALACTHLVPEAVHAGIDIHEGGLVLLGAFAFFVVLDAVLSASGGHSHALPEMTKRAVLLGGSGVTEPLDRISGRAATLLLGAACHNFVDGVLIAAAFMASSATGAAVTAAVFGHELPQVVGQLVILSQTGLRKPRAAWLAFLAAMSSVLGGIAGWALFALMQQLVGYAMLVSAASFIFVVLSVLLPAMTHEQSQQCCGKIRMPVRELAAMAAGIVFSLLILAPLHEEAHVAVHEDIHADAPAAAGAQHRH